MRISSRFARRHSRDSGYVLIAILLMLALLIIALAAVAPRQATQIRRDREEEAIHRGTEYAKAVKRYFRKFGRYPTRIEELESTNNTRFLRKRFKDPITGEDFRILRYGEQKSVPRGLFGAPLGATGAGGLAGGGLAGAVIGNALGGGAQAGGQQPQSPGTPASSMSQPLGSGQTFGGGPIIGVAGVKDQTSLKEWQGKTNYKDWEFYYDPRFDQQAQQGGVPGGIPQPVGSPLNPQSPQSPQQPNPQPNSQPQVPR